MAGPMLGNELARKYVAKRAEKLRQSAATYRADGDKNFATYLDAMADYLDGKSVPDDLLSAVLNGAPANLLRADEELCRCESPGPTTDEASADIRSAASAIETTYNQSR